MKKIMLYAAIFITISILGFLGTRSWLGNNNAPKTKGSDAQISKVIYQDLDGFTDAELITEAIKLYKKKEYSPSFRRFNAAFNKAPEKSIPRRIAANYLGNYYYKGLGVKKDWLKAETYYLLPEMERTRHVIYRIGTMYMDKKFSHYDLKKARHYLEKSLDMGVDAAKKALKKLDDAGG